MTLYNNTVNQRNTFFDVLKGIGILSVLIGHCHPNPDVIRFVYGFHLAIFFLVAGMGLKEEKYAEKPFELVKRRLESNWKGFFCYMTFFTLTRNLCIRLHLLPDGPFYSKFDFLNRTFNNFFLCGGETLGGALWFVPMFLMGLCLFAALIFFCTRFFYRARYVLILISSFAVGFLGLELCLRGYGLYLHAQSALVLLPLVAVGYCLRNRFDPEKVFIWPVALCCAFWFIWCTVFRDLTVEFSLDQVISRWEFYPVTFCGVYFISYVALLLKKWKPLEKILAYIGRYSFDLMALHILVFKLVDGVWGRLVGSPPAVYAAFPCAYGKLWPVYLLCSLLLVPPIRILWDRTLAVLRGRLKKMFGHPETVS